MSRKKDKRRTISVRSTTEQRLRKLAAKMESIGECNGSRSDTLEKLIAKACEFHGIPREEVIVPRTWDKAKPGPKGPIRHGGVVTF